MNLIISLTGLGCQSMDIAFKKRQIEVGFFLNLLGLLVGGSKRWILKYKNRKE